MTNLEPVRALNMDIQQQQTFIRCYHRLPEKSATTVRFFNHSDYYTVHAEDTAITAEISFCPVKIMGGDKQFKYICLSRNAFERLIRELLLIRQYRVEVYVKASQTQDSWKLEYKGSPGNLEQFEDILFDSKDCVVNSSVMCVKIGKGMMLGVSCVNLTENLFSVCEFIDNEFFTELDCLIAQLNPKECVIPSGDTPELNNLKKMLERSGILVIKAKKTDFSSGDIAQDLNRLLFFAEDQQRNCMSFKELSVTNAMDSLQAAIKYLNLTGNNQNFNQFKLTSLEIHRYVRIDQVALKSLNLINTTGEPTSSKFDYVYDVLNLCVTQQGRRLLDRWIRQPLRDVNILQERLDVVEVFVGDSETREMLSKYDLTKTPDLLLLAKKLGSKKATLTDCYKVYQTINSVSHLVNTLNSANSKSVKTLLANPISEFLSDLDKYQSMIEQTIDLELADQGEFFIKSSFDEEFAELNERKKSIQEKMQTQFQKAARDLGYDMGKNIKMESTDQHGHFLRVTLSEEPQLRKNKDYIILDKVNAGVRFTTRKLQELNETYSEVNEIYARQQKNIVDEILNVAAGYTDVLKNLNICIATVDVLVAFSLATMNASPQYVRPHILPTGSGVLRMKKMRHPCLEKQDNISFIPNDVEFEKDDKMLYIITGPNMGGKSTYIRTIGVNVLMAQIGCFVPCEKAEISLVDSILTRVGADDCELKKMSTFMVEMVESNSIIRSATSNSLVIIDELGRGTATYDGCGLAWAIAKYLAENIKSFTLFATHYHDIATLEELVPTVGNLHVTALFTDKCVTPLYQIKEGACDKSYGIQCARLAQFPDDVLEFATKYQEDLENAEGMKYIKDFEVSLKRKVMEEADIEMERMLKEIENLEEDSPDYKEKIKRFKAQIQSGENLFLKGLIDV